MQLAGVVGVAGVAGVKQHDLFIVAAADVPSAAVAYALITRNEYPFELKKQNKHSTKTTAFDLHVQHELATKYTSINKTYWISKPVATPHRMLHRSIDSLVMVAK